MRVLSLGGEAQLDDPRQGRDAPVAGLDGLPGQPERREAVAGQPNYGRLVDEELRAVDQVGALPTGAEPAGSAWAAIDEVGELRQRDQVLLADQAFWSPPDRASAVSLSTIV